MIRRDFFKTVAAAVGAAAVTPFASGNPTNLISVIGELSVAEKTYFLTPGWNLDLIPGAEIDWTRFVDGKWVVEKLECQT